MTLEYNQIYNSLKAVVPPGGVVELRLLGDRKGHVDSGYFDDLSAAATAIVSASAYYVGMYYTVNPVNPDLLARSYNRITPWAKWTTHDVEISRRRWLPIDIDARRPSGISSNEAQHQAALNCARTIASMLTLLYGFPQPMITDSGNGAWLLYQIDEENSEAVRDEIHSFIKVIKAQYDTPVIDIDTTVFNAARISRIPGTYARKGDSTPDRPHRKSAILQMPDAFAMPLSIVKVMRFNAANGAAVVPTVQSGPRKSANEYPADEQIYKRLNEYAMRNIKVWAPHFFPTAREYKEGYRVQSGDINQPYEEDLTIHPWPMGIKYFGNSDQGDATEGRRTPISVIAEFSLQTPDKGVAARQLADILKFPMTEFAAIQPQQAQAALSEGFSSGGSGGLISGMLGTKPRYDFKGVRSIAELHRKQFRQVRWIVKDVIPAGNMLLAARPKMRKTWLMLQLALAVARGRKFLDWECVKGDVLFLGPEDNERRIQNRLKMLQRFEMDVGDLSGFRYWTGGMDYDGAGHLKVVDQAEANEFDRLFPRGEALTDALDQYMEHFPNTSMIVLDTLQHFRGERKSRDIYASDYDAMMPLTKFASRHNVLVVPVTHEKKGNADRGVGGDFLEDVTGSAGISGGADGVISIKGRRGVQEENESRKLLISGRDVPYDYEVDMAFDAERGGWLKAAREDVKVTIRTLLARNPFMNQVDFMNLIPGVGRARLYKALTDMKMDGEIEQGKYGFSLRKPN